MSNVDVTLHAKVLGRQNFVGGRVVEHRLRVNASLVRECGVAGDVVIERY